MTKETALTEPTSSTASTGAGRASVEALAKIWAEALRLPHIDIDANFFDIGGDSLKAMEVIMRVGEVLQVDLPLMAFFEDPTISHLADVVDELGAATASPMVRVPGRREFPLSYSQQVFWLLEQQNQGTGIYNTHRIFRIHGQVDPSVLELSLNELIRRHDILRVRFALGADGPVQVVETGAPLHLKTTDLSALDAGAAEEAAMKIALEVVREPFNLERGQVLRARLVRLTGEDWLLCMAIHHVVSDGLTGGILFDELGTIYDALAAGEPNPLPELSLHFTDYAAWEREWMQGPRLDQELEYWRSALQGAPSSLDLPTDSARTLEPDRHGRLRLTVIAPEQMQRLQALAQSNGTTLFTALAAALRILLYRWSGQSDFLLGTVSSNRSRGGTERMIGCFVNQLPLRNPITPDQRAIDVLDREKSAVMDAFAHQDCPFAKIVEAINPERTSNDNPLFNVQMVLQNFPAISLSGRSFHAEHAGFDAQVALLDLRFIAMETPDGLQVSCEYKSSLFSEETVDGLLQAYAEVLQAIADPTQPVAGVAISDKLLRQAEAARRREHVPSIAISASFTAEPVEEPLNFLLNELGLRYRVALAPYQQVFQQLLDPTSLVRTADGLAIVLVCFEDWLHGETATESVQREKLEQVADQLIAAVRAAQSSRTPLILCFCPASRAMGQKDGWSEWLQSLEAKVADAFKSASSTLCPVQVVRSKDLFDLYAVAEYEDEYARRLGNVPYSTDGFSALGTMLARRIWGITENRYQVVAMDCDGVLWSGQCAESQPVVLDEPRRALPTALLEQRDSGRLLCLCSSSREEDVWAALESNPAMPLQRDDIIASAFGCPTSAEGLGVLARELGLDLDSFIFLHADPVECSKVEAECPEVLTLQVPADSDEIPAWLKHVWAFDQRQAGAGEASLNGGGV